MSGRVEADVYVYAGGVGAGGVWASQCWGFSGREPGVHWCGCVSGWKQALGRGGAAPVDLEATHISALEFVTLEELRAHAV